MDWRLRECASWSLIAVDSRCAMVKRSVNYHIYAAGPQVRVSTEQVGDEFLHRIDLLAPKGIILHSKETRVQRPYDIRNLRSLLSMHQKGNPEFPAILKWVPPFTIETVDTNTHRLSSKGVSCLVASLSVDRPLLAETIEEIRTMSLSI